ncbi:DNA-binding HxlR family transcriptional regulator [Clostridium algifaecis]|uniref:DNA-binding HxlR family transcriptional regulator n=1 Tax=Clostridium algifaecis TaxID=1472040 RepID=A0ABS4KTW1_9CLOT|nr:helix-turn-helix domain-containing protein [Clostridium algifaecis]MBP2033458.1 DNA-binding HxlR family transcriptional regulator [Clostridium algifaecis]
MIEHNNKNYICPLDLGFETIRGKWKSILLLNLYGSSKRFLELKRSAIGVSHKVLTDNLKQLEYDGLINKVVYAQVPPKVEYSLTKKGEELVSALTLIRSWSKKYYSNIIC